MRTETRFLVGAGAFGVVIGFIYWFLAYEDAGFVLLLLMGVAAAFIGGYFLFKGYSARLPEDDPEADHAEAAGEVVGRFSGGSIWPLVMGIGVVIAVEAFVFGYWLLGPGLILFLWAAIGFMLESRD
jgi:Cytochrome c oxidase subunit IV